MQPETTALRDYFEPPAGTDPADVVTAAIESGQGRLLLDRDALPPAFFDLSTGVAGAMVQRLVLYGIRMAAVVPDPAAHSGPFQDFAREVNAGASYRFFPDRASAVEWLTSG